MTGQTSTSRPAPRITYIAGGKLYVVSPDGSKREVTSDFAQGLIDRAEASRQRNEWKSGSVGWNATSAPPELVSLGMAYQGQHDQRQVNMITAVPLDADRMLYALQTDAIGGLFEYTLSNDEERRLVHQTEFRVGELDAHPDDERLIASLAYPDGSANLATMRPGGGRTAEITEGDSVDQAPRWAQNDDDTIVYQSAGIARGYHGELMGLSTFRIEQLDLTRGEHQVLAESDEHDLLAPQMDKDGTLYYIRRPHEELFPRPTLAKQLKDIALFPVRLCVAIFWFLNAFSMLFAKKPLTSASGPKVDGQTTRQLVLYGRVIEAQKASRGQKQAGPAVVPDTWELVRRNPQGEEAVIASAVGHYDLAPDGGVIFTNGAKVIHQDPDGTQSVLIKDSLIERVAYIG